MQPLKEHLVKIPAWLNWVILAEVLVERRDVYDDQEPQVLAGFAILSVFVTVGMSVAGY